MYYHCNERHEQSLFYHSSSISSKLRPVPANGPTDSETISKTQKLLHHADNVFAQPYSRSHKLYLLKKKVVNEKSRDCD